MRAFAKHSRAPDLIVDRDQSVLAAAHSLVILDWIEDPPPTGRGRVLYPVVQSAAYSQRTRQCRQVAWDVAWIAWRSGRGYGSCGIGNRRGQRQSLRSGGCTHQQRCRDESGGHDPEIGTGFIHRIPFGAFSSHERGSRDAQCSAWSALIQLMVFSTRMHVIGGSSSHSRYRCGRTRPYRNRICRSRGHLSLLRYLMCSRISAG